MLSRMQGGNLEGSRYRIPCWFRGRASRPDRASIPASCGTTAGTCLAVGPTMMTPPARPHALLPSGTCTSGGRTRWETSRSARCAGFSNGGILRTRLISRVLRIPPLEKPAHRAERLVSHLVLPPEVHVPEGSKACGRAGGVIIVGPTAKHVPAVVPQEAGIDALSGRLALPRNQHGIRYLLPSRFPPCILDSMERAVQVDHDDEADLLATIAKLCHLLVRVLLQPVVIVHQGRQRAARNAIHERSPRLRHSSTSITPLTIVTG